MGEKSQDIMSSLSDIPGIGWGSVFCFLLFIELCFSTIMNIFLPLYLLCLYFIFFLVNKVATLHVLGK